MAVSNETYDVVSIPKPMLLIDHVLSYFHIACAIDVTFEVVDSTI